MMIPTSTQPIRYVPRPHNADDPKAPAFFIRPGDPIERAKFEAELAGDYRAGIVYDFQLREACTSGVNVLLADDPGKDVLIALFMTEAANSILPEDKQEPIAAVDRQLLAQAREILAEHWPEYRALRSQQARRRHMLPLLAFRRFCVGWENVASNGDPLAHAIGPDGLVKLPLLARIPKLTVELVGYEANGLLYLGEDDAKN